MTLPISHPIIEAADFARRDNDDCGVVGVYGNRHAAQYCHLALYAMQHRGQESCGIAAWDGSRIRLHKARGLVSQVFDEQELTKLEGEVAIGHVRYSTTGSNSAQNAQPLRANYRRGFIAAAHNGNIVNAEELAQQVEQNGAIFQSTTDSELLIHLIAQNSSGDFETALRTELERLHGAFCMTMIHDGRLYALKDRFGFRPLCMGKLPDGGWIVASESCALDAAGAQFLREIQPGELVSFKDGEPDKRQILRMKQQAFCVFELIYYSRPDSHIDNTNIYKFRKRLGEELAIEHPAPEDADVVIPIPDSSNPASVGFARKAGVPWEFGIIRSHYIGRTFIQPTQADRDFGAKIKYNPVPAIIKDRSVVVVDDSVVRGTTSKKIVRMLRDAGAREIHFRVTAPLWRHPCYYGIDTPDKDDLLGNRMNVDEIREWLGVNSVGFLSHEGLMRAIPKTMSYCEACFTGNYLDGTPNRSSKHMSPEREDEEMTPASSAGNGQR